MRTFALALISATAIASKGYGSGYGKSASHHGPTNYIDNKPVQHSHYADVVKTQTYEVDDSTYKTITDKKIRQERELYDETRIDTVYDDVPETRVRQNLVTNVESKDQEVSTTNYTTKSVDAGLKDVTRYDIVDQVLGETVQEFRTVQKEVPIVESRVVYEDVTTTRDNYVTLHELCPVEKEVSFTVQEPVYTKVEVQVPTSRKIKTVEEKEITTYISKKVCTKEGEDECWGENCGYGWGWDCKWVKTPVTKTVKVPSVEIVTELETVEKTKKTYVNVEKTKTVTENEPCTRTVNYPTTTTNSVPRTELINTTKLVDVQVIVDVPKQTVVKVAVPRTEQQSYTTTVPVKNVSTKTVSQDFNVQSLEDEEYEVTRKVPRDVEVTRQRARYNDVEKEVSYDAKFAGTKTLTQDVIRQKRISHAHSDRAGYGHGKGGHGRTLRAKGGYKAENHGY